MITTIEHAGNSYRLDLSAPHDISIPLRAGVDNVNAFYIPPVKIEPIRIGNFVGSLEEGGSCNVNNVIFNPHGNGTHTECVGHISKEPYTIHECLQRFFFMAKLITVTPRTMDNGDLVITTLEIGKLLEEERPEALVIRTLPNTDEKKVHQYSGTNPAYLSAEAADYIRDLGILHLLIDLPSVDREEDGGSLSAHHAFWNYPGNVRKQCTITELIYVPSSIRDGRYFLNLQVASFENDAAPSKPVLYALQKL